MLAATICFFSDLTSFRNKLISSSEAVEPEAVAACAGSSWAQPMNEAPANTLVMIKLFLFIHPLGAAGCGFQMIGAASPPFCWAALLSKIRPGRRTRRWNSRTLFQIENARESLLLAGIAAPRYPLQAAGTSWRAGNLRLSRSDSPALGQLRWAAAGKVPRAARRRTDVTWPGALAIGVCTTPRDTRHARIGSNWRLFRPGNAGRPPNALSAACATVLRTRFRSSPRPCPPRWR